MSNLSLVRPIMSTPSEQESFNNGVLMAMKAMKHGRRLVVLDGEYTKESKINTLADMAKESVEAQNALESNIRCLVAENQQRCNESNALRERVERLEKGQQSLGQRLDAAVSNFHQQVNGLSAHLSPLSEKIVELSAKHSESVKQIFDLSQKAIWARRAFTAAHHRITELTGQSVPVPPAPIPVPEPVSVKKSVKTEKKR